MKYYFYMITEDSHKGATKIGISSRPLQRLIELNNGFPTDILRIMVWKCSHSRDFETIVKRVYKDKQVVGEWYNLRCGELKSIQFNIERLSNIEDDNYDTIKECLSNVEEDLSNGNTYYLSKVSVKEMIEEIENG